MVYKWATHPDDAVITRADGTTMLVDKIGEGMTSLVYLPSEDGQLVFNIELTFKKDGTPEILTNQDEIDMLKKVPATWRLNYREEVEQIQNCNTLDVPHAATQLRAERIDKGLMAHDVHRLEKNHILNWSDSFGFQYTLCWIWLKVGSRFQTVRCATCASTMA